MFGASTRRELMRVAIQPNKLMLSCFGTDSQIVIGCPQLTLPIGALAVILFLSS